MSLVPGPSLELDHLFVFVEPDFVDSADHAALRRFGLSADFGRVHAGQGTANRLVRFPGQALEFLWLADRREAEHNPLRLDRRADWRLHGGDPFGVCLRGQLDAELRERWFWPYRLSGMPEPIWIARMSDDPRLPMLFVIEGRHGSPAPESLVHPGGWSGIARATLTSRGDRANALGPIASLLPSILQFQNGAESNLAVSLCGGSMERLEIGPLTLSNAITGPISTDA